MTLLIENLPYKKNDLAPYISQETLTFHYEKHHKTYLTTLKKLISINPIFQNISLEEIIKITAINKKYKIIFNNAAQVWNHNFYWKSMSPNGGGSPNGIIKNKINKNFNNLSDFKNKFTEQALSQFGSGWIWVVINNTNKNLEIIKTGNAETPITQQNYTPILTCDVWEHAYYIDYKNQRATYIKIFLDHLINWSFAEEILSKNLNKN